MRRREPESHAVRRAGLDYWHLIRVAQHASLMDAETAIASDGKPHRTWLFSGKAQHSYLDVAFQPGDVLVFGKESTGLDASLLDERREHLLGIPTLGGVRSLNLANAVAIALFEALRQVGALTDAANDLARD